LLFANNEHCFATASVKVNLERFLRFNHQFVDKKRIGALEKSG
jgi:hypothetical protein